MSLFSREELTFQQLSSDRQANIEIVCSAYESMFCEKAYLTMPITTGKRYYDLLDKYGVRTIEELEKKRPGALREEVILPNIEEGKNLAKRIQPEICDALIVPGIFEARKKSIWCCGYDLSPVQQKLSIFQMDGNTQMVVLLNWHEDLIFILVVLEKGEALRKGLLFRFTITQVNQ
jgi:hypothetical protein